MNRINNINTGFSIVVNRISLNKKNLVIKNNINNAGTGTGTYLVILFFRFHYAEAELFVKLDGADIINLKEHG
jgi:hypothetical protein